MQTKRTEPQQHNTYPVIELTAQVFVLLDPVDYALLKNYDWRLRRSSFCFYAVRREKRDGKTREIKMHREIACTPDGYECHHINHNSLDNRKINLINLTPADHRIAHGKVL